MARSPPRRRTNRSVRSGQQSRSYVSQAPMALSGPTTSSRSSGPAW